MTTTQLDTTLRVNGTHLWDTLMQQTHIGAMPEGGVRRLTLTDLDRQDRDFFVARTEAAGYVARADATGNLFTHRPGHSNALPPVMAGSHIGTQPADGKFDGSYGVFADIEVVHALNNAGTEAEAPIEAAVWTNEGGSRFIPMMMGSDAFIGEFALDAVLAAQDRDDVAVGEALCSIGYARSESVGNRVVGTYFEAHIEQGPVLEAHDKTIDVVTDALGQRWYDVVLTGIEAYAGLTPMELRRNALLSAAELVGITNHITLERPPHAYATVGCLSVHPDSHNVIPGQISMTIDLRTADDTVLFDMDVALHGAVAESRIHNSIDIALRQVVYFPPQPFDATLVDAVRSGTQQLGLSEMDVISGADHGAVYLTRVTPTTMIFVLCKDGISHNEIEDAHPEHLEAGTNVLLHVILQATGRI